MRDDRPDLRGREALEIRFGDRIHQGLLDTSVFPEGLSFNRFLTTGLCTLVTIGAGLLERYQLHHEVQELGGEVLHALEQVGTILFDDR